MNSATNMVITLSINLNDGITNFNANIFSSTAGLILRPVKTTFQSLVLWMLEVLVWEHLVLILCEGRGVANAKCSHPCMYEKLSHAAHLF